MDKEEIFKLYKEHKITSQRACELLNMPPRTFFRKIKQVEPYWYETKEFIKDKERYINNEISIRQLARKYNKPVSTIHKHFLKDERPKWIMVHHFYNNLELGDIIYHNYLGLGVVESEEKNLFWIRFYNSNNFTRFRKKMLKIDLKEKNKLNGKRQIII